MKTIFFDFGGCIDAPGIHTRTLFWEAFLKENFVLPKERAKFQEAYTQADQEMMQTGSAKNLGLKEFNRFNGKLISHFYGLSTNVDTACDSITQQMDIYLKQAKPLLENWNKTFSLGIISNFTGNLEVILKEYAIRDYFKTVTESFYVGASKPEKKIFLTALQAANCLAKDAVYIGDNPVNDIAPAKQLGFTTILIHVHGQKKECGADYYIENLRDLENFIHKI